MDADKMKFKPNPGFDKGLNCTPLLNRPYPQQIFARAAGDLGLTSTPLNFTNMAGSRSSLDNPKGLPFFTAKSRSRPPSPSLKKYPPSAALGGQKGGRLRAAGGYDGHYEGDVSMIMSSMSSKRSGAGDAGEFYDAKRIGKYSEGDNTLSPIEVIRKRQEQLPSKSNAAASASNNTMLRKSSQMNIETDDSDDEYDRTSDRECSLISEVQIESNDNDSLLKRFISFTLTKFLKPQQQTEFRAAVSRLRGGTASKFGLVFIQLMFILLGVLLLGAIKAIKQLGHLGGLMWRAKFFLRNGIRRILWYVTLAKCGDTALFALIICAAPWLFLIAIIGFGISVAFAIKTHLSEIWRQLSLRLIY